MNSKNSLLNAVLRWNISSIVIPTIVHADRFYSYVRWIGLRGQSQIDAISVDIVPSSHTRENLVLVASRIEGAQDASKEIELARGYYIGLETVYYETDCASDPSVVEKIRFYGANNRPMIEFGLSRDISGLIAFCEW